MRVDEFADASFDRQERMDLRGGEGLVGGQDRIALRVGERLLGSISMVGPHFRGAVTASGPDCRRGGRPRTW